MKILISAAETSSDAHGAELLRALRKFASVDAFGVGGPKLQAAGLRTIVDSRELLAMGFSEILGRLPRILSSLNRVSDAARVERPDVAVVIDYPDFHFRLARKLKNLGIPVVYFIPPKVWAWRKSRLRLLQRDFSKILSILPFEVPFYEQAGVPVCYVGNPLVEELPLQLTRKEARERLKIETGRRVITAMPGSRPAELKRHVPLMLDALELTAKRLGERLQILMPLPATADSKAIELEVRGWSAAHPERLDVRVSEGDAHECLVAADAGLIKSGTSTLEAGILALPHVVVYRPSALSAWIYRNLIRYPGPVGLVNLVANGLDFGRPPLMEEVLCEKATPEPVAEALLSLLRDPEKAKRVAQGLAVLRENVLKSGTAENQSPSEAAAREILKVVHRNETH